MYTPPYPQAFGSGFVAGLSILDLLFALGPGTGAYLRAARRPRIPARGGRGRLKPSDNAARLVARRLFFRLRKPPRARQR